MNDIPTADLIVELEKRYGGILLVTNERNSSRLMMVTTGTLINSHLYLEISKQLLMEKTSVLLLEGL